MLEGSRIDVKEEDMNKSLREPDKLNDMSTEITSEHFKPSQAMTGITGAPCRAPVVKLYLVTEIKWEKVFERHRGCANH